MLDYSRSYFPSNYFAGYWPDVVTGATPAKITPGYWAENIFPAGLFAQDYWLEFGAAADDYPAIIPGHFSARAFQKGFYNPSFWPQYGAVSPPIAPDSPYVVQGGGGGISPRWTDTSRYPGIRPRIIDDDNEIMELLANILPLIIG